MSILDTIRSNAEAKQKAAAYDKQMLDNAMVAEREGGARDIVNGLAYELSKRPSVNMPWEFANQYKLMPANRLDSGQRGLGVNGYDADRYGVADERSANAAMQEEMLAKRAYDRQMAEKYNNSKQYVADQNLLRKLDWDTPAAYDAATRSDAFEENIDPVLAEKWMRSYNGHN